MMEFYISGASLRLWQIIIYSSLWIVIGCFIAATFRRMLGPEKVKRIFADGTRWGLVTGWLIGMLLPVCSLGVIPVVREMHRAGVKRGTIVAFGLTAPLFNPLSVLYGLTMSDPIAILSFSLCALAIVSSVGWLWGRFTADDQMETVKETMPSFGIKRSASVIYSTAKELVGPSLVYIAIGILASTLFATFCPKGSLQFQVERENLFAPVVVAVIATPIYSTPLLAMSQIGGMFQHGNSVGAAFSLLILGAGMNIGLFCWFGKTYGIRKVVVFFSMLMVTTITLAYLIDKPLYPKGVDPEGHTHAFDVYTNPFQPSEASFSFCYEKAVDFWKSNEFGGTWVLLGLICLGAIFKITDRYVDFEKWFVSSNVQKTAKYDAILPGWLLGLVVVTGLIASSVAGCYLYYPAPNDLLGDLSAINAKAVISAKNEDWDSADKWISYCDDLSRRLEVGVFLRRGYVEEFQSVKSKNYRQKLDILKMAVDNRMADRVDENAMDVAKAYLRLSEAFSE